MALTGYRAGRPVDGLRRPFTAWGHAVSTLSLLALLAPQSVHAQAGIEFRILGYNNFADTTAIPCAPVGPALVAIGPSPECTSEQLCVANRCARFSASQEPGFDATRANIQLTPDSSLPSPGTERFRGSVLTWTPSSDALWAQLEVSGSRAERYFVSDAPLRAPIRIGECIGLDLPSRLCGGSSGMDVGGIYLLTVRLASGEQASIQLTPQRVQPTTPTVTPTPTPRLPAISGIEPSTAMQGTRGLDLVINGANFQPGFVVRFEPGAGITLVAAGPPNFGFESPARIRQRIHIETDASIGPRQVFVTNPDGMSGGVPPNNRFTVTTAALGPCYGDCGRDGRVTIEEIVRGINIALGAVDIEHCFALDANNDARITIDEIISAINAALRGCIPLGTPVPTASPTRTPGAGSDCCQDTPEQTCGDAACRSCVCTADDFCCAGAWDNFCIALAAECPVCGCDPLPTPTLNPTSRDCCETHLGAGCNQVACEDCVCFADSFCCQTEWDSECLGTALSTTCQAACQCVIIEPF